jgi:hypothetical protein
LEPLLQLLTAVDGTHSPIAALHKSGSYRGFICPAFSIARPVSFDPIQNSSANHHCEATFPSSWICDGVTFGGAIE